MPIELTQTGSCPKPTDVSHKSVERASQVLESSQPAGCSEAWALTERGNDATMVLYKSLGGIEEVPDPVMFTFKL